MNELLKSIIEEVQAEEFQIYLTASNDPTAFRKKVYPEYKGNRKAEKPIHYAALREYLVSECDASMSTTIEADDAIGIDSQRIPNCVVVSIDKDLLQLPGKHYNFVKKQFQTVTKESGLRFFYKQMLMGDTADNIKGVPKIGEVKAERILAASFQDEESWFGTVRSLYNDDKEMWKNGECLWILQQPFPRGTFSYHPLGSQLLSVMERRQLYSQSLDDGTLDAFIQETSTDGKSTLGLSQAAQQEPMVETLL